MSSGESTGEVGNPLAIVVVGAGIAAIRFVQRLRARGSSDPVIIVGAEGHQPYDRPPLSKHVLTANGELPQLLSPEAQRALAVDLRLGVTASGLDPESRRLRTDAGDLAYHQLVIATGARPTRLPGLGGHVLRTWDDAARLRAEIAPGAVLAVLGAGLIGCEVAASARSLGAEVHLIDIAAAPMARVLGPDLSALVTDLHLRRGVHLHLGCGVASADGDKLTLHDGSVLAADVLLQAVGVRPDTAWLAGTGLDGANGVPCDETGQTAIANVYAIGDVAAWAGVRAEHWTSAIAQADRVAALLTGQDPPQPDVSYCGATSTTRSSKAWATSRAPTRCGSGSGARSSGRSHCTAGRDA